MKKQYKMGVMRAIVPFLLFITSISYPAELKFCIQVAADRNFERIREYFNKVSGLTDARVERRGQVYLLRVGASDKKSDLADILKKIKKDFRDAYIKKCEIDPSFVVLPAPATEKGREAPKEDQKDVEKREDLVKEVALQIDEVKARLEDIGKKVDSLSTLNKNLDGLDVFFRIANPSTLEKFLVSIGILIGGLFLFTWILILWVYRKVAHSSRIVDLVSKGYEVKGEGEKILYRKNAEEDWKEA